MLKPEEHRVVDDIGPARPNINHAIICFRVLVHKVMQDLYPDLPSGLNQGIYLKIRTRSHI